jgi:hypothetical protein
LLSQHAKDQNKHYLKIPHHTEPEPKKAQPWIKNAVLMQLQQPRLRMRKFPPPPVGMTMNIPAKPFFLGTRLTVMVTPFRRDKAPSPQHTNRNSAQAKKAILQDGFFIA